MKTDERMRILGSITVIVAYFIILYVNTISGVMLNLLADIISVPYFVRTKSWDVVIMIAFLATISFTKLATNVFAPNLANYSHLLHG